MCSANENESRRSERLSRQRRHSARFVSLSTPQPSMLEIWWSICLNKEAVHAAAYGALVCRANFSISQIEAILQKCGKIPFYVLTAMSKSYSNSGSLPLPAHMKPMTQRFIAVFQLWIFFPSPLVPSKSECLISITDKARAKISRQLFLLHPTLIDLI